ncbi:glycoside hydrolase family 45 protein [Cadophora sp. DSE1049]|nr:glycoside hydrolase family 45 protein [Cadophora sp. DSE1049]
MLSSLTNLLLFSSLITTTLSTSAVTTRYWDCCKPSCSWPNKAQVSEPVRTCNKNDLWPSNGVDPNAVSTCDGGDAYACSNMEPWAVNENLAEWDWCCACYELTFTSTSLAGKKIIVQITNTGGDLSPNHFDLAMPGAGFDGAWVGNQYGGYTDRNQCYLLPEGMIRDGCLFRFDWFMNADNPSVEWREVSCPKGLVERSGCGRWS